MSETPRWNTSNENQTIPTVEESELPELNINSGNIEEVIQNWVTPEEALAIVQKLNSATNLSEDLKKIRETLKDIKDEKIKVTSDTWNILKTFLIEIEANPTFSESASFNELKDKLSSQSEIISKLFIISDKYFDTKLGEIWINWDEKENVKLVLWDKLLQNLDIDEAMRSITLAIKWKVTSLFKIWEWEDKEKPSDENNADNIVQILEWLDWVINELETGKEDTKTSKLYWSIDLLMWDSFLNLEESKDNQGAFDSVEQISSIIEWGESKRTFDDIKNATLAKIEKIKDVEKAWVTVKGLLSMLSPEEQGKIADYLKEIAEEYPILGIIMSLFLGNGLLEWNENTDNKGQKSINNLLKLVNENKDTDNDISKLDKEKLSSLKPEELKEFFLYLDKKKIDYTGENFWKEVLNWESKNKEINNVHNILSGFWVIIENEWEDITTNFIKKLNNVEELEERLINYEAKSTKEAAEELEKEQEADTLEETKLEASLEDNTITNEKAAKISAELVIIKQKKEARAPKIIEADQAATEAQETQDLAVTEKQQAEELKESILAIKSLPTDITYKWENINLALEGNNIVLWEKSFKIVIIADSIFAGDVFRWVDFKDWNLQIEYKSGLASTDIQEIDKNLTLEAIKSLLTSESYESRIKLKNASIKIEKIV